MQQQPGCMHCSACVRTQASKGQQLMLEMVAVLGALLLTLDRRLPGPVREAAIVAHYRWWPCWQAFSICMARCW